MAQDKYTTNQNLSMEVLLPVTKHVLAILAENFEKLQRAGVNIELKLDSKNIINVKEEDGLLLKIHPNIVEVFEQLQPLTITTYKIKNNKIIDGEAYIPEPKTAKAKCPFCGHEEEYIIHLANYTYPYQCPYCHALVTTIVGDEGDVTESVYLLFKEDALPDDVQVEHIDSTNIKIREVKHREEVRAVRVDEYDENMLATWLLFAKLDNTVVTNKEIIELIKNKEVIIDGKKIIYNGIERRDYDIREVGASTGSARVYLPATWVGKSCIVLRDV